ncbi:hypothetical protein EYF80_066250 [Liparis tanakae]|uniref:Uncharacterized protein n=1 Tax=Liparis tanakae TaxID=230148 RepID=A0A4Z2E4D8_9TELE|nr:hypothetical protein EYF80_066250 [Liparis tanakae]
MNACQTGRVGVATAERRERRTAPRRVFRRGGGGRELQPRFIPAATRPGYQYSDGDEPVGGRWRKTEVHRLCV